MALVSPRFEEAIEVACGFEVLGCKVNGEVRQNSSTKQIIFQVPKLVEFVSDYFTLEPGDLIFTGTPIP